VLSIVRRNFRLKVFAFALAVAAWAYFHFSAGPNITAHFVQQLNVPIAVSNLRPGYVARYTEKFAAVTIDAPRNGPAVRADAIAAVLDLRSYDDTGVFNVPVEIIAPKFQIRSLTPASVTLTIDRIAERTVPVSIEYHNMPKGVVVESAGVNPSAIVLRGVAADLARVQSVRVDISIPNKTLQLDTMVRPIAADAGGGEIGAVQVSPNLVRVRARVIPSTGTESK
jgi:YbbR domain-containing protein